MFAAVLFAAFAAPVLGRNFVVVDMYENAASCSSKAAVQASALTEVGVCATMPEGLPPPLNTVKSFKITDCTNASPFLSVSVAAYMQAGCGGIAVPYTFDRLR